MSTDYKENFNDLFHGLASNQYIQAFALGNIWADNDCIDDEVANIIANSIIQNAPLKEFEISFNEIGTAVVSCIGWLEIFAALQMNPNSRLEELNLHCSIINEAVALSLSNVILRHTTSLKTFNFGCSNQT